MGNDPLLTHQIIVGIALAFGNFVVSVAVILVGIKLKVKDLFKLELISFIARYLSIATIVYLQFTSLSKPEAKYFGLSFILSTFFFIMIEIIIFHYASNFVFLKSEDLEDKK